MSIYKDIIKKSKESKELSTKKGMMEHAIKSMAPEIEVKENDDEEEMKGKKKGKDKEISIEIELMLSGAKKKK